MADLDRIARDRGIRRVALVREVIEDYVVREQAARLEREMREYVEELAPASDEFVREADDHTVERLLRETEW